MLTAPKTKSKNKRGRKKNRKNASENSKVLHPTNARLRVWALRAAPNFHGAIRSALHAITAG